MQAHSLEVTFRLAKIVFYPKKIIYPLLLPSHNCIIITMFSFQGAFESQRNSMKYLFQATSVNLFEKWWRLAGSNRWPPACKAGALPAELNPHIFPCPFEKWWAKMDSNHRPHDYQSCALASWAIGPYRLLHFLGTSFPVPSKLNNAVSLTLCTDLRTLRARILSSSKSP